MEKFKGTPGPWIISSNPHNYFINSENGYVATIGGKYNRPEPVHANACLIAAAPELLEALIEFIELGKRPASETDARNYYAHHNAVKLVAKALGLPINLTDPLTQAKIETEAKDVL